MSAGIFQRKFLKCRSTVRLGEVGQQDFGRLCRFLGCVPIAPSAAAHVREHEDDWDSDTAASRAQDSDASYCPTR